MPSGTMKRSIFRKTPDHGRGYSNMPGYLPHNVSSDGNDAAEVGSETCPEVDAPLDLDLDTPAASLQLLTHSPMSTVLWNFKLGKKYHSMNRGSPYKATTMESRTTSTSTVQTQSLTSSSPDSASRWSMQDMTLVSSSVGVDVEEEHPQQSVESVNVTNDTLSIHNFEPLWLDPQFVAENRVPSQVTSDIPSIFRVSHSGPSVLESSDISFDKDPKNNNKKKQNPVNGSSSIQEGSLIQQGIGLLDDCIVEEEDELNHEEKEEVGKASSCYLEEELNITLHPTIIMVSSDLTENSLDSLNPLVQMVPSLNPMPPKDLDTLWWNFITQMSTCLGYVEPTSRKTLVPNAEVEDASANLSTMNTWALCGVRK